MRRFKIEIDQGNPQIQFRFLFTSYILLNFLLLKYQIYCMMIGKYILQLIKLQINHSQIMIFLMMLRGEENLQLQRIKFYKVQRMSYYLQIQEINYVVIPIIECNKGLNRNPDLYLNCNCLNGYHVLMVIRNHFILKWTVLLFLCLSPFLICLVGSIPKFTRCQDILMNISSDQFCACSKNSNIALKKNKFYVRFLQLNTKVSDLIENTVIIQFQLCTSGSNRQINLANNEIIVVIAYNRCEDDLITSQCYPFTKTCLIYTSITDTFSDCYPDQNRELANDR